MNKAQLEDETVSIAVITMQYESKNQPQNMHLASAPTVSLQTNKDKFV